MQILRIIFNQDIIGFNFLKVVISRQMVWVYFPNERLQRAFQLYCLLVS